MKIAALRGHRAPASVVICATRGAGLLPPGAHQAIVSRAASTDAWDVMSTARSIRRFTEQPVDDATLARCRQGPRRTFAGSSQGVKITRTATTALDRQTFKRRLPGSIRCGVYVHMYVNAYCRAVQGEATFRARFGGARPSRARRRQSMWPSSRPPPSAARAIRSVRRGLSATSRIQLWPWLVRVSDAATARRDAHLPCGARQPERPGSDLRHAEGSISFGGYRICAGASGKPGITAPVNCDGGPAVILATATRAVCGAA
jgi:hypothetical protein